jgi:hypothetical protein
MSTISNLAPTILSGVLIFVLGQIFIKFIVEPLHEQSILIGKIANALVYYIDTEKGETFTLIDSKQAPIVLREHASNLMGISYAIPFYWFWELCGRPLRKNIVEASQELLALSNKIDKSSLDRIKKIADYLNIGILSERFDKNN